MTDAAGREMVGGKILGPFKEYGPDGYCCRLTYSLVDNDPDFTQIHLCPHCWRDTKYLNPGAGYCGHCGKFFDASIVDREAVVYQRGKAIRPVAALACARGRGGESK